MRNNRHAETTIIIVTIVITAVVTSPFDSMTIVPRQVDALSIYDPDTASPDTLEERIDQPLEQDDYTATTKPTVNCVMDTIENLQSFLSCLGAK